jgi:hypothetical protein
MLSTSRKNKADGRRKIRNEEGKKGVKLKWKKSGDK